MHPISQFLADVMALLPNKEGESFLSELQTKTNLFYQEYQEEAAQASLSYEEKETLALESAPQAGAQEEPLPQLSEKLPLSEREEFLRSLAKQRQVNALLKHRLQARQRKIDHITSKLEAKKERLEKLEGYEAFYTFVQQRYPLIEKEYHKHEALKKFLAKKIFQSEEDSSEESLEELSKSTEESLKESSAL